MSLVRVCVTCRVVRAGWTQAINTLGMCANPSEHQLRAEVPTTQRPTRAIQNKFAGPEKNREVVKVTPVPHSSSPYSNSTTYIHICISIHLYTQQVMVFKGANGKGAVIRAITYDLLFNNMKSIVMKTASK